VASSTPRPSSLRHELWEVARLSLPVVLTQLGMMTMGVVDTLMVGRLGVTELAASALANTWQWTWLSLGFGIVLGIDPMISQAHGRGDGPSTALALQRGIVLALLVSVPIVGMLLLTGPGLRWLGQEPEVAALAHRYNLLKLTTVPCFLVYSALRQYLQGRTLVAAATWVIWLANLVHVAMNWALIFGHLGSPALGIEGAAIASSISMALLVAGLALWVRLFRLHAGAWRPWDAACLDLRGLRAAARLGLPVGLTVAFESWAFSLSTLMAGWLGRNELAGHQIVLNVAALSFMVPLGISQGAATRVGNLIGAGNLPAMRRALGASLLIGASVMIVSASAFTLWRQQLPRLYSSDPDVILIAAQLFPLAAAFQLSDGTQAVASGLLRGMGRPDASAVVNLIGYYVIALPFAYVLAFTLGHGLIGVWSALVLGLTVVAVALVVWVMRTARLEAGPRRVGVLPVEGLAPAAGEPATGE
jgi:MATE family multidrug resistance protein